jgi:hypothetical protein
MLEGTIIDPAIRKQLTRQYREWNNARSKIQGELKCNGCKKYFPREGVPRGEQQIQRLLQSVFGATHRANWRPSRY